MWWLTGADLALPVGDIIYFGGIAILGLTSIAVAERATAIPKYKTKEKVKEKEAVKDSVIQKSETIYIYRHDGTNPGNLVPSKKDVILNSGLSFSTVPMPNSWQTTIEQINATGVLFAIQDKPTHVSVYPIGGTISDWRLAGSYSIWTRALISVSVKIK